MASTSPARHPIRALILTPTRELSDQVADNASLYAKHTDLRTAVVFGGVDIKPQAMLLRAGVEILIATPGRLLDHLGSKTADLSQVQILVLDEADRMLDMGFIEDINSIIEKLPEQRQNLLFSATLSKQVKALAKTAIPDAIEIEISRKNAASTQIEQWLTTVDKDRKSALLSHLIKENNWAQALIFIQTKHGAAKLVSQLEKRGITAEAFHSGRSQAVREQLLIDFKAGKVSFLVATGVASRGIDIDALERVINYDLPDEADDYIHRIGRTGRAGNQGEAISFVSKDDFRNLCAIERRLGHIIERKHIEGFEPKKAVPISILDFVPKSASTSAHKPNKKAQALPYSSGKPGTFEATQAKKHRSAKSKPQPKQATRLTQPDVSESTEKQQTQGETSPSFNPWLSGSHTK